MLNPDGTAAVIVGSQDIGTGTKTVFAQIAAEELGMPLERVTVRLGDSATGPYAPVSWGSMTVSSVGPAIRQAAADARQQLCEIAAGLLDVPADQVAIRDGSVYLRNESQPRLKVSDIIGRIDQFTVLGKGARGPNPGDVQLRTFGAQFAEVEVDTLTGDVRVLRVVTVHDIGRVMNPLGAGGQCEGAVIQGIGYALTETRVVDQTTGIVLNANLEDYLVPTALDVPAIDHAFVGPPDERANNLGAKGLGEPSLIPTAPAIANAIARAIGVRFRSLPITRDKILEAIRVTGGSQETGP
jgi:xanthine dehydrogenase YagR molybdenum-binding subunit